MQMEMEIPSQVEWILQKLREHGFEAIVVGGCVRDAVMGRTPHDWDVATAAPPEEMKRALAGCRLVETGLKHGTLTVLLRGLAVETTTFRVDGVYSDNRHPDEVCFTGELKEDLARRDFTMNALAYSRESGVVDPFGGMADIARRTIRCVGNPDLRFREDGLRILRALRFAAELGFSLEAGTAESVRKNAPLLRNIAAERIQAEWNRLLCGNAAGAVLREYRDVFCVFLPELEPMFGFEQHNRYHTLDVWEHTVKAVESVQAVPILRLTMLLHDIGKPPCFTMDEMGVGHFYGHNEKSAEIAANVLRRLKYDNRTAEQVITLVKYHDLPITGEQQRLRRLLNRFGEENLRLLLKIKAADMTAQNPKYRDRLQEMSAVEAALDAVIAEKLCFSLKDLEIDGNDLLALGFPRGEEIGKTLQQLLEEVMAEKISNRHWALMNRARLMRGMAP